MNSVNLIRMDIVEQYIVDTIVAIRRASQRPDAESLFKFISTSNASNFTISDTVDALDKLKQKSKIENKQTKKGLDSFFLAGDQSYIDNSCNQHTDQSEPSKDQRKNIAVDILVETAKTKDAKTPIKPDKIDGFTAQLVAMKAFFMNEVFELKNEIARLKEASLNAGNSFSEENLDTENLKYQISLLQRENTFIKTELNNKQHIIEKLLNSNCNQSNVNDINITDNAHVNKNHSVFENSSKNKVSPSENVIHQNRSGKPNVDFNKRNSPKKKVTVIGDSMKKYLRRENLSSKNYEVKIAAHPGSTKEDLIDYVKPVVRKKQIF